MPGPSLGTNLFSVVDWTTAFPFIDLFKITRPWYTQTDGSFDTNQADMLKLDSSGWVESFTQNGAPAPFDRVSTVVFTQGQQLDGIYVLDWEGEGDIDVSLIPDSQIISRDDGKIVFALKEGQPLQISISSTDPNNNGNYIRDIRLYNQQDADLLDAGKVFAPEFLSKIDDFRSLRFMHWMDTIDSDVRDWSDRRPDDYARESSYGEGGRGVSIETMVALANETNTDPWFTIPHKATDDYIKNFVSHVKENLEEGLVARFEFSNEVWNWGFEQTHYAQSEAKKLWGDDVEGGWMQWYGMRAARMAEIVEQVFGDETGERALSVFATQSGWPGLEKYALDAPAHVAAGGVAPKDAPFHVYAIAPYFGGEFGLEENAALREQWMKNGEAGFKQAIDFLRNGDAEDSLANIGKTIAYHAVVAKSLGLQLEAYEGGQHVVDLDGMFGGAINPAETSFYVELVKRPEFQQLYKEYFNIWKDNGGGLMAQFTDFGMGGQYGSWGIWDSAYADDSSRALAVKEFRDSIAAWWGDDRPAQIFDNGVTQVDRDGADRLTGTRHDDALVGLDGDNRISGLGGNDLLTAGRDKDLLSGAQGNDTLVSGAGADTLFGGQGNDILRAGAGDDRLYGGLGNDTLTGDQGNDVLRAAAGNDLIVGGDGNDTLVGGDGADTLVGGQGVDIMYGGDGAEHFVFSNKNKSTPGTPDRIADFQRGIDKIDLSSLSAEEVIWRGKAAFSGTGKAEAQFTAPNGETPMLLRVDTNGDGVADMSIILTGVSTLTASDIVL